MNNWGWNPRNNTSNSEYGRGAMMAVNCTKPSVYGAEHFQPQSQSMPSFSIGQFGQHNPGCPNYGQSYHFPTCHNYGTPNATEGYQQQQQQQTESFGGGVYSTGGNSPTDFTVYTGDAATQALATSETSDFNVANIATVSSGITGGGDGIVTGTEPQVQQEVAPVSVEANEPCSEPVPQQQPEQQPQPENQSQPQMQMPYNFNYYMPEKSNETEVGAGFNMNFQNDQQQPAVTTVQQGTGFGLPAASASAANLGSKFRKSTKKYAPGNNQFQLGQKQAEYPLNGTSSSTQLLKGSLGSGDDSKNRLCGSCKKCRGLKSAGSPPVLFPSATNLPPRRLNINYLPDVRIGKNLAPTQLPSASPSLRNFIPAQPMKSRTTSFCGLNNNGSFGGSSSGIGNGFNGMIMKGYQPSTAATQRIRK